MILRTRHNTRKFSMILLIRMLLTVFFIIEMLIILVFTWLVHCKKAHCLNREYLFTSQSSMYKEQKEVIFPAGIFIFARILLFSFCISDMRFHGEYLKILLLIRSGELKLTQVRKKQSCKIFSLEFKWTDSS